MRIKILHLALCLSIARFTYAQTQLNVGIGFNYGGPVPTKMDTLSKGIPLPGLYTGFSYIVPISKKIWFAPDISYSFRHFKYKSIQKKDTLVDVEITGKYVTVPTYFTAQINGYMITHHFEIKTPIHWKLADKLSIGLGPYTSWIFTGIDCNTINVQIGEGSLIDNVEQNNKGFEGINPFELGMIFSCTYQIDNKFSLQMDCTRSLTSFYKNGYYESLNEGEKVFFYQTNVFLSLRYNL